MGGSKKASKSVAITGKMAKAALDAAKELAEEVRSGTQFGIADLFRDGGPHCVLGHLYIKANLPLSGDEIWDHDHAYKVLNAIATPCTVECIYCANDSAFGDIRHKTYTSEDLANALDEFAKETKKKYKISD